MMPIGKMASTTPDPARVVRLEASALTARPFHRVSYSLVTSTDTPAACASARNWSRWPWMVPSEPPSVVAGSASWTK